MEKEINVLLIISYNYYFCSLKTPVADDRLKSPRAGEKERHEMEKKRVKTKCEKSLSGKHEFGKATACQGSWHHKDKGGPIFQHKTKRCIHCGFIVCFGWDKSKKISEGWGSFDF